MFVCSIWVPTLIIHICSVTLDEPKRKCEWKRQNRIICSDICADIPANRTYIQQLTLNNAQKQIGYNNQNDMDGNKMQGERLKIISRLQNHL